ncbi:MAG: hydrogenase maturation protease [Rhodocyclaceae bacterium]|nr:hydrogenase maturation protease [Rhodocyclaceae bacterium]MBX3668027.1 hydrogenase maturation protease [Rhodocyclaceae bacterium]
MLIIIGCGNSNRSDDGVGVAIARSLLETQREHPHPRVRIFDAGTGGMDIMFQARGAKRLIIIDAAKSGAEAGAIFCVPGKEVVLNYEPSWNLHAFRWNHAIAAGRKIFRDQFPDDVWIYLIEAGSLDYGLELSPAVAASAARVAAEISDAINAYHACV